MGFMSGLYFSGYLIELVLLLSSIQSLNITATPSDLPSPPLGHIGGRGVGVVGGLVVPVGRVPLRLPAVVEATLVRTGGSAVAGGSSVSSSSAAAGAPAL